MTNITMGVYQSHTDAESAIKELITSGVTESEISYLYTDTDGSTTDGQTGEKLASGAIGGGVTGAVLGGIAGLIVANGILPGFGTLFVAGPLATALGLTGAVATTAAGAATGAAAGGIIGALTNLGVSSEDAQLYESMVKKGHILVVTRTESPSNVKSVFEHTNATEVREYVM